MFHTGLLLGTFIIHLGPVRSEGHWNAVLCMFGCTNVIYYRELMMTHEE